MVHNTPFHSGHDAVRGWAHIDRRAFDAAKSLRPGTVVPIGVKDVFKVEGMPTRYGIERLQNATPSSIDADVVHALRATGFIPVGMTVSTALAIGGASLVRNPHDELRTAGASSAGSAAAVASGVVPVAIGSQTLGSVTRPASYCGLWAFVPSRGRVSRRGMLTLSRTLDRPGIFASEPDFLQRASEAILNLHDTGGYLLSGGGIRLGLLDLGLWPDLEWSNGGLLFTPTAPGSCLVEALPWAPSIEETTRNAVVIADFEAHCAFESRDEQDLVGLKDAFIELVPFKPGIECYERAITSMAVLQRRFDTLVSNYDAVIMPAAVGAAPLGYDDNGDPGPGALFSLLGVPTVVAPLFKSAEGLPIGCQIVGRLGDDLKVLHVAKRLASHVGLARFK